MVARDQKTSAALAEPRDGRAILGRQTLSGVDREQPQFVEFGFVDFDRIASGPDARSRSRAVTAKSRDPLAAV